MSIRKAMLPEGWYPRDASSVRRAIADWKPEPVEAGSIAAIAPHAGWRYSGRIASIAWSALAEAETIVIVGGHLGPKAPILIATEDAFESPFGNLSADVELRARIGEILASSAIVTAGDRAADNTVEVQLPFMGLFAPRSRLLWIRAPASQAAIGLGKAIAEGAASLGRKVAVLGSTDLTHYGPDYGFEPAGRGMAAEVWVRDRNDRAFLEALLALDPETAIARALDQGSACSPGAAAAALSFAMAVGVKSMSLLAYGTSLDVRPAASFVGYAALATAPAPPPANPS